MATTTTIKCEACGNVFETMRTDEEAAKEFYETFGRQPDIKTEALVCEDCYEKIMRFSNS